MYSNVTRTCLNRFLSLYLEAYNNCNNVLKDVSSYDSMKSGGWKFGRLGGSSTPDNSSYIQIVEEYCKGVDGGAWWGYAWYNGHGTVSASLQGTGSFNLTYGNCNEDDADVGFKVVVRLGDKEISSAGSKERIKATGETKFTHGDTLQIEEYNSVMVIHSITFECEAGK